MASLANGDNAVFEECFDLGCNGLTERSEALEGIVEEGGKAAAFEKGVDAICDYLLRDPVDLIGDEAGDLDDFGYLIEEEMGKVTLDSVSSCLVPNTVDESGEGCDVVGGNVIEIAVGSRDHPPSGSEEETSSSSSSGASSSSDDETSDEEKEEDKKEVKGKFETLVREAIGSEKEIIDVEGEMEEGEIIASDIDEMVVAWSGDEDEGGRIASKNELTVLPLVPPVNVTLEPHHQPLPVGVVLSIVGAQIIVEGVEKHNPLDEGSILWITETRSPLGMVDETFGPVKNPYYIIRHNSESEVPSGLKIGDSVSFVPEYVNHILHDKSLYAKAYDASGANDEETSEEEFSDDEKEAEYKRMLKMKKRGKNQENVENKKTERKEPKTNSGNRKRGQAPTQNGGQGNQVRENHQDSIPSPVVTPRMSLGNNNQRSSSLGHAQNLGFTMQSSGANGMPFQPPQSMGGAQNPGFPMQSTVPNGVPFQAPQSMGVSQNPGFNMQYAGANGIPFQPPQSINGSQNPGFTMQSNGVNGIPFQPPQNMGIDGFSTNNTLPWFGQVNTQMVYQIFQALEQTGMNTTSLPQNPAFSTMQPGIGPGTGFTPWPSAGFGQNMFDPSVLAAMLTAQGQHLPFPFNAGQQAFPSNLQQMGQNSSINTNVATTSQPQMSVTSSQGPYHNMSNPSQMGQQVFANNVLGAPGSSNRPDLTTAGTLTAFWIL